MTFGFRPAVVPVHCSSTNPSADRAMPHVVLRRHGSLDRRARRRGSVTSLRVSVTSSLYNGWNPAGEGGLSYQVLTGGRDLIVLFVDFLSVYSNKTGLYHIATTLIPVVSAVSLLHDEGSCKSTFLGDTHMPPSRYTSVAGSSHLCVSCLVLSLYARRCHCETETA